MYAITLFKQFSDQYNYAIESGSWKTDARFDREIAPSHVFGPGQTLRQAAKIYKSATKNDQKCIDAFQLENSAFQQSLNYIVSHLYCWRTLDVGPHYTILYRRLIVNPANSLYQVVYASTCFSRPHMR